MFKIYFQINLYFHFKRLPFDLHVLCAPPAFILSQDQTLLFLVLFFIHFFKWIIINFFRVLAHYIFSFLVVLITTAFGFFKGYCLLFNVLLSLVCDVFYCTIFFIRCQHFFLIFLFYFFYKKVQNNKLVFDVIFSLFLGFTFTNLTYFYLFLSTLFILP